MRRLTYKQGCQEIETIMQKYGFKAMRDKKVKTLIDITLWGIAEGSGGPEMANIAITKYRLNQPANGSHEWFIDDKEHNPVRHLDPHARVPDHEKIFPKHK